jgi:hypothetical protein
MKAFIAQSLGADEKYCISLLAEQLRLRNISIAPTYNLRTQLVTYQSYSEIAQSQIFIGIIGCYGTDNERVFNELNAAISLGVPVLLFVEKNVPMKDGAQYILRYDGTNPFPVLRDIISRIVVPQQITTQKTNLTETTPTNIPWLIGGALFLGGAIGVLAAALSSQEKPAQQATKTKKTTVKATSPKTTISKTTATKVNTKKSITKKPATTRKREKV